jgi:uncharacterized cupredoxin-like copper-binding protein
MFHGRARIFVLALVAPFLSPAAARVADAMVVEEVIMNNKPDGGQVMILSNKAGTVLFKVMNRSANLVHEFLVLRTDLDPGAFPVEDQGNKVDETKMQGIKELGDLEPSKSGQMKMTLKPGTYVLFCNEPGHFKAGMVTKLVVAP